MIFRETLVPQRDSIVDLSRGISGKWAGDLPLATNSTRLWRNNFALVSMPLALGYFCYAQGQVPYQVWTSEPVCYMVSVIEP